MKKKIVISMALVLVFAMLALTLTACVPDDPAKAKEKMEKAEYKVTVYEAGSFLKGITDSLGVTGLKTYFYAVKQLNAEEIEGLTAYYFDSKDNANSAFDALKKEAEEDMTEEEKANYEYGKSGSVVYMGTKAAVKAFKK